MRLQQSPGIKWLSLILIYFKLVLSEKCNSNQYLAGCSYCGDKRAKNYNPEVKRGDGEDLCE